MVATAPDPPPSPLESETRRIRKLLEQRQFAEALRAATALLAQEPTQRDALYLVAVSERYLGRIADALRTLERLERSHPAFGRAFQERGHCLRAVGQQAGAIASYEEAVRLNPVLHASWKALAELQLAAGHAERAAQAATQSAHLARLAPPVLAAAGMMSEGDLEGAERLVRRFLLQHGDDVEAMRLLAQIGVQREVLDDAETLLKGVLTLAPEFHLARYDYACVLSKRHKHAAAVAEARRLLAVEPNSRLYRTIYATACVGLGDHEEALRVYRELLGETPGNAELHLSIAHAQKTLGRQGEAIATYRAAAEARPSFGDAYWSLANLKTYRFAEDEIARMRALEAAADTALVDRYHLCFALGKALEDRGAYEESFRYYERGNALKRTECRYDAGSLERGLRRQAALCTREFFAARAGCGSERRDVIFIVGLPRSGSTLIEQILASHPAVEGTTELADIPRLVQQLQGREHSDLKPRYPGVLAELTPAELHALG